MKKYLERFNKDIGSSIIVAAVILGLSHLGYGYIVYSTDLKIVGAPFSIEKIALETDLKFSKWQDCLNDKNISKEVNSSVSDGETAGVTGTPTTFIIVKEDDGYHVATRIEGARDYDFVKAAVDSALKGIDSKEIFKGKVVSDSEFVNGTRDKVFIIEYADAECPYCIAFHPILNQVMNDYKDRVGYVYRNFPLTSIHRNAEKRAEAIVCSGKVGGSEIYFKYISKLYEEVSK